MFVKKTGGQIYGAKLTASERKAMNMEIQRAIAEYDRKNADEIDAIVLWNLHQEFGFGTERLKRFSQTFMPNLEDLCKRYEVTDNPELLWVCTRKLLDYGIDISAWGREFGG